MYFILLVFSSLVFADDFNRLYVESGTASSFLQSNWNKYQENYHPNYAFDDNPVTAWVEGVDGNGEGQTLEWEVSTLDAAEEVKLDIFNGYQKSEKLFAANSSVKEYELHLYGTRPQFHTIVKGTLENKMGPQTTVVKLPENHGLTKLLLKVVSTWPGKTYKDTCISDIKVAVKSKVPYNSWLEKHKQDKLMKWIKDRLAAAAFFSRQPSTYPFSGTAYHSVVKQHFYPETQRQYFKDVPGSIFYKEKVSYPKPELLAMKKELLKKYSLSLHEKDGWQKLTVKPSTAEFLPDGLATMEPETPYQLMKYFHPDELSFFEVNTAIAEVQKEKTSEYTTNTTTNSHHRIWKENGELRAVSWLVNREGMERGPYNYNVIRIMVYEKKKPIWYMTSYGGEGSHSDGWIFSYNSEGKISGVQNVAEDSGEYDNPPYEYNTYEPATKTVVKK